MPQLTIHSKVVSSQVLETVIKREKNNDGAEFTLKSKLTGKDYTFKISRSKYNNTWYTHVSVETGYMTFTRLGHYFNGVLFKDRKPVDTPSAKAITFVLRRVEQGQFQKLDEQMEVMHLGCCLVCGKTLTDAESIERGIGPVCAGK